MADVTFTISIKDDGTPVLREIKKEAQSMGDGVADAGKKASGGVSSLTSAFGGLRGVLGALGLGLTIREIVTLADTARNLEGRLKGVTASTAELNAIQQQLFATAQQTRTSYQGTTELFVSLTKATKDLGLSQQETVGITKQLNQLSLLSGASSESASNALFQLIQTFRGGILTAQEYNSIIDQAPTILEAMAAGMGEAGISMGEFRRRVIDGGIPVEELIASLQKMAGQTERQFAQMPLTVEQAMTQVGNSLLKFIAIVDKATDSSNLLASALSRMSRNIDQFGEMLDQAIAGIKADRLREVTQEIQHIEQLLANPPQGANFLESVFRGLASLEDTAAVDRLAKLLFNTEDGATRLRTALAALKQEQQTLRQELTHTGTAAQGTAEKINDGLTPAQRAANEEAGKLTAQLTKQTTTLGLTGKALADVIAAEVASKGATAEHVEAVRQAVLAQEAKKQSLKGAAKAEQDNAAASRKAKADEKKADEEETKAIENKRKAFAAYQAQLQKSRDSISDHLTSLEEQTQGYELQARELEKGIREGLSWEKVQRNIARAAIDAKEATGEWNQEQANLARGMLAAKENAQDLEGQFRDLEQSTRDFADSGVNAVDVFEEALRGLAQGTIKDIPEIFEQAGKAAIVKFASSFLFGKGKAFDIPFQANVLGLVGNNGIIGDLFGLGGQQGAQQFGGNFLGSLFGGGVSGQGLFPSIFGSTVTGSGGFLGGIFGSPGTIPGFGGVGPNIPGTGIFKFGNPFSFGNLAGGFLGSLAGGGINSLFGIGQSKPGALGAGFGGIAGGFGGGIAGGALLGAQLGAWAGPIGAAVGAVLGTVLGGVIGDLFKPGRIATEKKEIVAFFNEVFGGGFKVKKEPAVAAGLGTFAESRPANLALGALFASNQKNATQGTIVREGGQFLANLKDQGATAEEAKKKTLELAAAIGGDLVSSIKIINDMTASGGILSMREFGEEIEESRKNLAKYGDTSTLTVRELNDLALAHGNTGSFLVSLNDLYAGLIDISTGFSESVNGSVIANDLLAQKFTEVAGGAAAFEGAVGGLASKVTDGSLTIEEAVQQFNALRMAAGETALELKDFTLSPEAIVKELAIIQAARAEAGKATEGLGSILADGIMNGLGGLGDSVDAFFKNLFGQQVLGTILQSSLESLNIEKTLAPIFEKIIRAQTDFAAGTLSQADFQSRLKDIFANAGPDIDKIKTGLLAAGESGRALLQALGLLPEAAAEAANAAAKITFAALDPASSLQKARAAKAELQKQLDEQLSRGPFQREFGVIRDLRAQLSKANFGDTLAEDLRAGIADGFQAGVEAAILNAALAPAIAAFQTQMEDATNAALKDGVLTAQEQADLANLANAGIAGLKAQADALEPALQSVDKAATAIKNGSSVSAADFQDIKLSAEATKKEALGIDDALQDAAKALAEKATLDPVVDQAKDIRDFLVEAANALNKASLPPTAPKPFASGGMVGGSGSGDVIPALLDPREFVVNAQATQRNLALLSYLNSGGELRRFATGGPVSQDLIQRLLGRRVDLSSLAGLTAAIKGLERVLLNPPSSAAGNLARKLIDDLTKQLQDGIKVILDPIKAFIGESADPVARVREEFETLKKSLLDNRAALEKSGVDVDKYLASLASALPERLREAVEAANAATVSALASIKGAKDRLLGGLGANPFEEEARRSAQIAQLQAQFAGATGDKKAQLGQQLTDLLAQQVERSGFDKFGLDFAELRGRNLKQIEEIERLLQQQLDEAYKKAQVPPPAPNTEQSTTPPRNVENRSSGDTIQLNINMTVPVTPGVRIDGKALWAMVEKEAGREFEDAVDKQLNEGKPRATIIRLTRPT